MFERVRRWRLPKWETVATSRITVDTSRGPEPVELWSDGLAAVGEQDAYIRSREDFRDLLVSAGLDAVEATRLADRAWEEDLERQWRDWGLLL